MADLVEIGVRAAFCGEKSMEGCLPDQFELPSLLAEWVPDSTIAIGGKQGPRQSWDFAGLPAGPAEVAANPVASAACPA